MAPKFWVGAPKYKCFKCFFLAFASSKLDIEFAKILSVKTMFPKVDNIFFPNRAVLS